MVRECYIISKNCNTSYIDALKMSYQERKHILSFVTEEFERLEQANKERQEQLQKLSSGR